LSSIERPAIILGFREPGKPLGLPGDEGVVVCSPTGGGKTGTFAITNMLCWPHSAVVLDVKGTIFQHTAGYRKRELGQEIYYIEPSSRNELSNCWDPLSTVDRRSKWRLHDISRIAYLLFPDTQAKGHTGGTDKFWEPASRDAFQAVSAWLADKDDMPFTLPEIARLFRRGDALDLITTAIIEGREQGLIQFSQYAIDGISDYANGNLEQVEGIRKNCATRLASWVLPNIQAAAQHSDFDLRDLRRKKMTVYVGVRPSDIDLMRPYLASFFEMVVSNNCSVLPAEDSGIQYQCLLLLDEFIQLKKMEALTNAARYSREYGLRIAYIVHNKAQVRDVYGDTGAVDIFGNVGAEVYFGTKDLDLLKELSERCGYTTEDARAKSRPAFGLQFDRRTVNESPQQVPWLMPQEIMRMQPSEHLILRSGMQAERGPRLGWWQDPELARRAAISPPAIPRLPWDVPMDDGQTTVTRVRHAAAAPP
jgi:type IV secretion system protein VirD4